MFFELNAQPQHLGAAQLSYATVQHDQIRVIDMDTNSRQSNVAFLLVVRWVQFEESTIMTGDRFISRLVTPIIPVWLLKTDA